MRKLFIVFAAGAGLLLGCATTSAQQTSAQQTSQQDQELEGEEEETVAQAEAQPPRTKLVCETQRVTGSHIPQKICRPVRDVAAEREAAQESFRNAPELNQRLGQ
jgi:hypothetical protein